MFKKLFFIVSILSILIITTSISYYFVIFLPQNNSKNLYQRLIEGDTTSIWRNSSTPKPSLEITKKEYKISEIVSLNQKYIVQVICQTTNDYTKGSGIVIGRDKNNNLIVLTNYHVIENYKVPSSGVPPCVVVSQPDEWSEYYYSQPTFWMDEIPKKDMEVIDFAFLTVKSEPKIEYSSRDIRGNPVQEIEQTTNLLSLNHFPTICSLDDLSIGKDVIVMGYPAIGGIPLPMFGITTTDFTITEGIISETIDYSHWYFKTSAKIDQGNSGGGAFLKPEGCLAGMPTFVITGQAESLGRLLNLVKLKDDYLLKILSISQYSY